MRKRKIKKRSAVKRVFSHLLVVVAFILFLFPSQRVEAYDRVYDEPLTLSTTLDSVTEYLEFSGTTSPNYIKSIDVSFSARDYTSTEKASDSIIVQYQMSPGGQWYSYQTYSKQFAGTIDFSSLRPINIRIQLRTAGTAANKNYNPTYIYNQTTNPAGTMRYGGLAVVDKPIVRIRFLGDPDNYNQLEAKARFVLRVGHVGGSAVTVYSTEKQYAIINPVIEIPESENYRTAQVGCANLRHQISGTIGNCFAYIEWIELADGTRVSPSIRGPQKEATVSINRIVVYEPDPPVSAPGNPVHIPSPVSLTSWSTTEESQATQEYNLGQRIEELAVKTHGFYGTYTLEGWDDTLGAWVVIKDSGGEYTQELPESVHSAVEWIDVRGHHITKLRLTATHASHYGIPSQVSVPIVRMTYNGPNTYLTAATPFNTVLQWTDGGNTADVTYEIWRQTLGPNGEILVDEQIGTTKDLTFTTTDQTGGKHYRYRIRARAGNNYADSGTLDYYTTPTATFTALTEAIRIDWESPVSPGSASYTLAYESNDGVWTRSPTLISGTTTWTQQNLSPTKRYRFALTLVAPNHGGVAWEVWANAGTWMAPSWRAPGTPQFVSIGSDTVTITWSSNGIPAGQIYRLYRNGVKIYEGPDTTFTDTGLTPGAEYRYKVTAVNIDNVNGAFSPEARVVLPTLTTPRLWIEEDEPKTPWNVILSWQRPTDNPPEAVYEIWRQTFALDGTLIANEKIGVASGETFETTDQTSGRIYYYRLRVSLDQSTYVDSDPVVYITAPIPTVTPLERALRLEWQKGHIPIAYNVYLYDGSDWQLVGTSSESSYVVQSLTPERKHQVALAPASLPAGGYPWKATAEGTPLWHAPGAPTFTNISSISVTISWDPNGIAPGTTYQLFRDGVKIWEGTETFYTDSGLMPNTTYRYKVTALNADRIPGTFSAEMPVQTVLSGGGPVPGGSVFWIEGGRMYRFNDGMATYLIPHVRSHEVVLHWNIDQKPNWVRYGLSLEEMGKELPFSHTHIFRLPPQDGVKTIYAETSNGDVYYVRLVLDTQAPTFNIQWAGAADGTVHVRLEANDNINDSDDLEISVNGGSWVPFTELVTVPASGGALKIKVRDPAGNTTTRTLMDSEPPFLRLAWLGNATVTRPGGYATLLIHARDNLFDETDLLMSIDGGPWEPYRSMREVQLSGHGMREVVVRIKDPMGNMSSERIYIFVLP